MAHRARLMPWFRLKDRIGHGASTYREIYQNQTVAVRVFATEEFREFLHAILKLSHQNVVTYLDCILANDSYPHRFDSINKSFFHSYDLLFNHEVVLP